MLCDKCGSLILDNFIFCEGCKKQLEQMGESYQQVGRGKPRKMSLIIIAVICVVALFCMAVFLRPDTPPPIFAGDATTVSAGGLHTVALRADGTVLTSSDWRAEEIADWSDIMAVAAGRLNTVGLRADGTVVTTASEPQQQVVDDWENIVAVSAAANHTVGLRSDGTVVATGPLNTNGQLNVTGWRNIMQPSVREPDFARFWKLAQYEATAVTAASAAEIEAQMAEIEALAAVTIRLLLENIPYQGMTGPGWSISDWLYEELSITLSETERELVNFINVINRDGMPRLNTSFHSPEEADHAFLRSRAFWYTRGLQWRDPESEWANYFPELVVIESYIEVPWEGITLHSHMEQTARLLFGVELEIDPYAMRRDEGRGWSDVYNIHGVYVHNQGGFGLGPFARMPMILSYEYIGGGYEVVCAFIVAFFDDEGNVFFSESSIPVGSLENGMTQDGLLEYLETTTRRHTITLIRNPDGGFYYHAHILPVD